MERIRWTCNACGAIHHYIPAKCSRCAKENKKDEQEKITFDTLMEGLDEWQTDKKE